MTTAAVQKLFKALRRELVPLVRAIAEQAPADDRCLRQTFGEPAQLAFGLGVAQRMATISTAAASTRRIIHSARGSRRRHPHHHTRARG
jgi:Zn-dependent M32 family carboxypeptidase